MGSERGDRRGYYLWTGIFFIIAGMLLSVGAAIAGISTPLSILAPLSLAVLGGAFVWQWRTDRRSR